MNNNNRSNISHVSNTSYEPPNADSVETSREENPIVFMDIGEICEDSSGADALGSKPVKIIGRLIIELRKDICPVASSNFLALIRGTLGIVQGINYGYRNTRIHRVVKDILLQGGDLLDMRGECSRSIYNNGGYFKDENFILRHVGAGVLSCCSTGPDLNGSIFQITLTSVPSLDDKSVVFGCVVDQNSINTLTKINMIGHRMGEPARELRIIDCGVLFPPDI